MKFKYYYKHKDIDKLKTSLIIYIPNVYAINQDKKFEIIIRSK